MLLDTCSALSPSVSADLPALSMPGESLSLIMNSISTGFIVLSIVIGKSGKAFRFPFTAFASGSVVIILFLVMWRIGEHHPERLVIDTPKDVFTLQPVAAAICHTIPKGLWDPTYFVLNSPFFLALSRFQGIGYLNRFDNTHKRLCTQQGDKTLVSTLQVFVRNEPSQQPCDNAGNNSPEIAPRQIVRATILETRLP